MNNHSQNEWHPSGQGTRKRRKLSEASSFYGTYPVTPLDSDELPTAGCVLSPNDSADNSGWGQGGSALSTGTYPNYLASHPATYHPNGPAAHETAWGYVPQYTSGPAASSCATGASSHWPHQQGSNDLWGGIVHGNAAFSGGYLLSPISPPSVVQSIGYGCHPNQEASGPLVHPRVTTVPPEWFVNYLSPSSAGKPQGTRFAVNPKSQSQEEGGLTPREEWDKVIAAALALKRDDSCAELSDNNE
jgi:hypothetical protein